MFASERVRVFVFSGAIRLINMAQISRAIENAPQWRECKRGGPGVAAAILKHVQYKGSGGCIHVRKTARVRLDDGRRVYATQAYWEHAFGVTARRIDARMRRSCAERAGFVCMSPAHISHAETGETVSALIARLWEQRAGGKPKATSGGCKAVAKTLTEETLWQNRPDATEELVIDVEDIPESIETEIPAWRILDYFNLTPTLQFAPPPPGEEDVAAG